MKTVVDLTTALKTYFTGKDTDAKQAVEAVIAPVETDATSASKGYAVGKQLILNDVLYDVIAPITAGDALTVGTNISAADPVTEQIADVSTAAAGKASKDVIDTEYETIGSAALYSHSTGTIFYATDGKVYSATSDITVGDTLTVGTNCALDTLVDAFNSQNSAIANKENKGTLKTATLAIGATSVTFTQIPTTGTNLIKFYNDLGINYTAIDNSVSGQVTLTFEEQSVAVNVYCEIKGVS